MSSLLDEAIVDAKALREAVLKNAESALLEAFAPKIEEAVAAILEQDMAGGMPMDIGSPADMGVPSMDTGSPPGGLGEAEEVPETGSTFLVGEEEDLGVKDAVLSELDDDSTLEEDVEIDITRGELASMLESINKEIAELEEEVEEEDVPVYENQVEIDEDLLEEFEGDGIEITEENIEDIVESLLVDIAPAKSGWAGTPESVMQHNEELAAAMAESDKFQEENKELFKAGKQLAESNKKYKAVNNKLKKAVDALKNKLDEVNLTSAKLLYTNRILRKSSLNERQKTKIVEALSSAGSVNEAKVLYETLQNAVGSSRKDGPQSLSEAVTRPSTMLPRRKSQSNEPNPFSERMKVLAGIKNN
jgi:hypothetical protein